MRSKGTIKILIAASIVWFVGCVDSGPGAGSSENVLNTLILEKAQRAGVYKAASLQAEKNGDAEVAAYLGEIAEEERTHAARLSVLEAVVKSKTKQNLEALIAMENKAVGSEYPSLIASSKEEGNDSLSTLMTQIKADDSRHVLGLKGIMERVK